MQKTPGTALVLPALRGVEGVESSYQYPIKSTRKDSSRMIAAFDRWISDHDGRLWLTIEEKRVATSQFCSLDKTNHKFLRATPECSKDNAPKQLTQTETRTLYECHWLASKSSAFNWYN